MRKVFTILFFYVLPRLTFSQDTIISIAYTPNQPASNFEDRDTSNYFYIDTNQLNNLWQIGTPSKSVFSSAYSPPLALVTDTLNPYATSNISSFEFVVQTNDWTFISFFNKINSDSLLDGGIVEVSNDNGASWTNIINSPGYILTNFYSNANTISSNGNQPGFTGNSPWILSTIQFNGPLNYVRFKFTFTSDSANTNKDGWILDNFQFQCYGTSINENESNSLSQIFPNPFSSQTLIELQNPPLNASLTVVNSVGQVVSHIKNINQQHFTLSRNNLPCGYYLIQLTENGQIIFTKKIIVAD